MKFPSFYINQFRKCKDTLLQFDQKIDTRFRYFQLQEFALNVKDVGVTEKMYAGVPLIVSLTTYGRRLQEVYITIESLLHQTVQPNKIVLNLSNEFNNSIALPNLLKRQVDRGLELLFCEDIKSYTKLLPALKKFPDAIIITVDDDMIYPCDFVEKLIKSYVENPQNVYFYYGHTIIINDNTPTSYDEWVKHPACGSSYYNLPTGVDGVLYPPGCFYDDIFDESIFMNLCPYADDLWFKTMTLLKGYSCEIVPRYRSPRDEFLCINPSGTESLAIINRKGKLNDVQFKRLFDRYELSRFLK